MTSAESATRQPSRRCGADAQLGAVPRHPRVVPVDPGQPGAVRRRGGEGEEVRPGDQDPDGGVVAGGRAVERDRDDRAVHLHAAAGVEPGLRLAVVGARVSRTHQISRPSGDRVRSANRNPAPSGVSGGRLGRPRAGPGQPVKALVGEVREDEVEPAGLIGRRHRQVRPAAVLVHPGAGVPRGGQQLARLVVGAGRGHDRHPPALGRAALLPPHLVAREGRERRPASPPAPRRRR